MTLKTYDDYVARIINGFDGREQIYGDAQTAYTTSLVGSQNMTMGLWGQSTALPGSLPTGVTAFIVSSMTLVSSTNSIPFLIGHLIHFGQLNIGTNVYAQDNSMPSVTEAGVSNQTYSAVFAVANTALNSTPGSFTITYNANDGTTGNTTAVTVLTPAAINTAGVVALNTGHWGASAITAAAQSGGTTPSGIIDFYGVTPLCIASGGLANNCPMMRNFLTEALSPTRWGAGTQFQLFQMSVGTTRAFEGHLSVVGDN